MARAECDVIEDAAIFAESDFAFGAAVEIIENYRGETALGDAPEIADVDYVRMNLRRPWKFAPTCRESRIH